MTRITSKFGIAAALTLGMLSTAAAQTTGRTTPPTTKVPVGKEMPPAAGEVVTIHDTVTKYSTDTLRLPGRTDTLRLTGPTVTVTRFDTVTVTETANMGIGHGLYLGLGAGSMFPAGGMSGGQTAGYAGQLSLGIDPKGSPIGGRVTASISRPYEERPTGEAARPTLMNLTADLKLRLPSLGGNGAFPRLGLYAVGGAAYVRYQALRVDNADGTWTIMPGWHDGAGFDAGGGATLSLGHKRELFVEMKVIEVSIGQHQNPVQVPLLIGFNWY